MKNQSEPELVYVEGVGTCLTVPQRIVATERDESDACEAGTPGCCIAHHAETLAGSDRGTCETW